MPATDRKKLTLGDIRSMSPEDMARRWPEIGEAMMPPEGKASGNLATARAHRHELVKLPQRAADLLAGYRKERLALEARQDVFGPKRREAREALREAHRADLAALRKDMQRAGDGLHDELRKARGDIGPLGLDEALGWERLRSSIAGKSRDEAQEAAIARLRRALTEGDTAMLRAGGRMLADHLTGLGDELLPHHRDWLAVAAGDEMTAAAVALEQESRTGIAWTTTALGFVEQEVERDSNLPAMLLPTYERGELLETGDPPNYAAAAAKAEAEAGVRAGR